MGKGKGEYHVQQEKIWAVLRSGSETIIQGVTGCKKKAQETFLRTVLQNEGRYWTEFYEYVKRRKENRENIPAIKDHNGKPITDPIEKSKSLNSYYASLFSLESNNPQIQSAESG